MSVNTATIKYTFECNITGELEAHYVCEACASGMPGDDDLVTSRALDPKEDRCDCEICPHVVHFVKLQDLRDYDPDAARLLKDPTAVVRSYTSSSDLLVRCRLWTHIGALTNTGRKLLESER